MDNTIRCTIQTPDKKVYDNDVESINIPAFDGEMGFLYNHTPLIAELGIGAQHLAGTQIRTEGGERRTQLRLLGHAP